MNTPQSKISKQNATNSKCLMKIAASRYGFLERIKVEISQLIVSCVQYGPKNLKYQISKSSIFLNNVPKTSFTRS